MWEMTCIFVLLLKSYVHKYFDFLQQNHLAIKYLLQAKVNKYLVLITRDVASKIIYQFFIHVIYCFNSCTCHRQTCVTVKPYIKIL